MPGAPLLYLEDDPVTTIARAARALLEPGSVIAFPTDTVYGLLAVLDDDAGYRRIYQLKRREPVQPLQLLALAGSDLSLAARAALTAWPEHQALFDCGQATAVLDPGCFSALPPAITRIQPGPVGLRLPAYAPLQELLALLPQQAAWATSANVTGEPPITLPDKLVHAASSWLSPAALVVASRRPLTAQPSHVFRVTTQGIERLRG